MTLDPARALYEACGDLIGWQLDGVRMLRWRSLGAAVRRRIEAKLPRVPADADEARAILRSAGPLARSRRRA